MLTDEDIRVETVVSHRQLGPGQIVDVDNGQVMVDFASDPGRLMSRDKAMKSLSRLRNEGLEARLVLAPEETRRWVEESPLRLVAAAIVDVGRRTETSDLKDKLSPAVINVDSWRRWWTRVQNALKESRQFDYDSRNGTRLKVPVTEVYSVSFSDLPLPSKKTQAGRKKINAATRLADWVRWMQADEASAMPTGASGPPDALIPIIEDMPAEITPRAVERLAGAIEERVISASKPPKSTPLFLDSLVAGLYRWCKLPKTDDIPVAEITKLAAHLLEVSDESEPESIVNWLADYASTSTCNVRIAANAMLLASQKMPDGTQRLLGRLHNSLDDSTRIAIWQQLLASSPGQAVRPPVEQWLRTLTPEERCTVVSSLLVTVRDDSSGLGIDSLLRTEWNLANTKHRHRLFDAIALSWILRAQLLPDTETIIQEVAESLGREDQETAVTLISNPWNKMIQSAARIEVERVREDKDQQITDLRERLLDAKAELERTRRQARHFQGELQNATHRAALEVSRSAIEVLGGTLQSIIAQPSPLSTEVADITAKMELALRTLNAELFGRIGETEPYEPSLHEVDPVPTLGTEVRVTAPGVRYKMAVDRSAVIIKKRAQAEVQV